MIRCSEYPAPARMLLLTTLFYAAAALCFGVLMVSSPVAAFVSALIAAIVLLLLVRPSAGVYLLAILYLLSSSHFNIKSGGNYEIVVHLVQVIVLPVFLAQLLRTLVLRKRGEQSATALSSYERWMWLFAVAFAVWSAFTILRSDNLPGAAAGWWQFNCNFLIVGVLLMHLRTCDDFVRLLGFYTAVAVCFALSAVYATYHAFSNDYTLAIVGPVSIHFSATLFNTAGGFIPWIVGMVSGFGCCGKDEMSLILFSGTAASVFLFFRTRKTLTRVLLFVSLVILQTVTYQVFSRTSVIGSLIVLLTATLIISAFRKRIIAILLMFVVMNIVAYFLSEAIRPEHMKKMETTARKVAVIASDTGYTPGNMGFRKRVWGMSLNSISEYGWLGGGPQALAMDDAFVVPHGHNLFLGLLADYGIPGCLMICALLATLVWKACGLILASAQKKKHSPEFFLVVLSVSLIMYTLLEHMINLFIWSSHLWFVVGLLWASMRLAGRSDLYPTKEAA